MFPIKIAFKNVDPSDAVENAVRERAEKLGRFFNRITGCDVVVALPNRRRTQGKRYSVSVDLVVPGGKIIVSHAKPNDRAHEDVYLAIRDSFNAAGRALEDHARKMRGDVKTNRARNAAL
jgi:ribosomal subunit interface protein